MTNNSYNAISVAGLSHEVGYCWLCFFTIYNFFRYLFYVLWVLKIVLITLTWKELNGMIVILVFGYWISFVMCICIPI